MYQKGCSALVQILALIFPLAAYTRAGSFFPQGPLRPALISSFTSTGLGLSDHQVFLLQTSKGSVSNLKITQ